MEYTEMQFALLQRVFQSNTDFRYDFYGFVHVFNTITFHQIVPKKPVFMAFSAQFDNKVAQRQNFYYLCCISQYFILVFRYILE